MLTSPILSSTTGPRGIIMRAYDMTKEQIIELLQSILPHMTSRRVARLTGKNQRTIQKWLQGEENMGLSAFDVAVNQRQALSDTDFAARLRALIDDCQKGGGGPVGLHPEVIGSHLAAEYERVTGLTLE